MTTPGPSDVWLPFRPTDPDTPGDPAVLPGERDGSLRYVVWDGEEDFPADPARCALYVVPYLKGPSVSVRPIPHMPRLRAVQTLTAGVDQVLPAVPRMPPGSVLCNAGPLHNASTAELALALTLAALRDIPGAVRAQSEGRWEPPAFHPSLADRRVLLLGYGGIGSAVEDRLGPFEVAEVIRVARTARDTPRGPVHALAELPALLPRAEVVIVAVPLTDETRRLLDAALLARMPDGALLVNVARGAIVDTDALLAELESGRLRAALDVTDPEPLPADHPLWRAPGTLVTPHVGGPSTAFRPRAERLLLQQLTRFAAGEPLRYVVASR
ncbi:2-hydroxyacid dehydrogenase [Streptomyces sp. 4N509B]|uniref:2-hydroxyacid dehydrogenase n=1 Tax=Streptomyces sp. 4N509B TaxID=3457413 RepID=UPI003FD0A73D